VVGVVLDYANDANKITNLCICTLLFEFLLRINLHVVL
jgi:hypothetical protein